MTADKILKTTRMMEELELMMITGDVGITITIDHEKRIDVPREMDSNKKNEEERAPSSEILIAMPDKKGSKKYTTYLGLVDSGSLVNKEIVEYANFNVKLQKKPTKWDTATGVFQTDGSVVIEQYCLPQFTRKRHITTSFHMFQKCQKDKYDFILSRGLLKILGLDIHYSASQFVGRTYLSTWCQVDIGQKAKLPTLPKPGMHLAE